MVTIHRDRQQKKQTKQTNKQTNQTKTSGLNYALGWLVGAVSCSVGAGWLSVVTSCSSVVAGWLNGHDMSWPFNHPATTDEQLVTTDNHPAPTEQETAPTN